MDIIAFNEASTANSRIEKINANPDSTSGIVTVPKVIASGETITIPTGRVAILPNVQIDGVINVEGEVFIPSGATLGDLDAQLALKAETSYVNAQLSLKANTADLKEIGVGQTLQTFTVGTQRIAGTNYTNSTGKPIWIIIGMSAGAGASLSVTAGGTQRVQSVPDAGGSTRVIVPILNGESYSATPSVGTINYWAEIR